MRNTHLTTRDNTELPVDKVSTLALGMALATAIILLLIPFLFSYDSNDWLYGVGCMGWLLLWPTNALVALHALNNS